MGARRLSPIHGSVRLGRRDSGAAIAAFHYQGTVPVLIAKTERNIRSGADVEIVPIRGATHRSAEAGEPAAEYQAGGSPVSHFPTSPEVAPSPTLNDFSCWVHSPFI